MKAHESLIETLDQLYDVKKDKAKTTIETAGDRYQVTKDLNPTCDGDKTVLLEPEELQDVKKSIEL